MPIWDSGDSTSPPLVIQILNAVVGRDGVLEAQPVDTAKTIQQTLTRTHLHTSVNASSGAEHDTTE